jgi:DNA polymerase
MPVLHRDFETRSFAELKRVGAARYAADPTTEVACICYAVDDGPIESFIPGNAEPIPKVFEEAANNPKWYVAAHNDAFESAIEEHVLKTRYNWPLVPIERHICSMATAQYHGLPGALEKIAAILALPVQKDVVGKRLMLRLAKPKRGHDGTWSFIEPTPEESARRIEYCRNDVTVEREILRRLPPLPAQEMELWRLDRRINSRGFCVDLELADAANRLARLEAARINSELLALTDGVVASFTKCGDIIEFVNARGHAMTKLNRRAVATVRAHKPDWTTDKVLELRQAGANITVSKFAAVSASAFPDRRVRGILHYYGAHTGRWTSSGLNPHNLPREERADAAAVIATVQSGDLDRLRAFGHPIEAIAGIARGLVTAPPGKRLLIGDFSTLESRIVAWLAGEQWKIDNYRRFDATGDPRLDPYCRLASRLLKREVTPDDAEARQRGKTADLAFGFCGSAGAWRRFMPDDPRTDEQIKAQEVDAFRRLHPATVQLWLTIERAALDCVRSGMPVARSRYAFEIDQDNTLQLVLPSGRRLFYPQAEIDTGRFGPCIFYLNTAQAFQRKLTEQEKAKKKIELGRTSLIENLVQATGRDLLTNALLKLDAAGFEITLHVHDEIVVEIDADKADAKSFKRCMLDVPEWAYDLPLMAKVRISERYIKTDAPIKIDAAVEMPAPAPAPVETLLPIKPPMSAESSVEIPAAPIIGTAEPSTPPPPIIVAPSLSAQDTAQTFSSGNGNGRTTWADENYGSGESSTGATTAIYVYRNADGSPFMRVRRTADKKFPTERWTGTYWEKRWPARPFLPYRLPELIAALPSVPVFVPQGEKDCERLATLGLIATTNCGGASASKNPDKSKWWPELNEHFKDKQLVYVLEDNDEAGRLHGDAKMRALAPIVPEIVRVCFPELPEGGDVSDWLDQLNPHTARASLLARCEQARKQQGGDGEVKAKSMIEIPLSALDWTWKPYILRDGLEVLSGLPGLGKSLVQCSLIATMTTGRAWPDGSAGPSPGKVLIVTGEDGADDYRRRLQAVDADLDKVMILESVRRDGKDCMFLLGEDLARLERFLQQHADVRMLCIDPITGFMTGRNFDSHRATDVRSQLTPLSLMAKRSRVTVAAVTHPPKSHSQRALDHFIGSQAFVAAPRCSHVCVEERIEGELSGRRLFMPAKNNHTVAMPGFAYRIEQVRLGWDAELGEPIEVGRVAWEGPVDITADEALAAARPGKEQGRPSAQEFVKVLLLRGPITVKELQAHGQKCGLSKDQLRRAREKLGVVTMRRGGLAGGGAWWWAWPEQVTPDDQVAVNAKEE